MKALAVLFVSSPRSFGPSFTLYFSFTQFTFRFLAPFPPHLISFSLFPLSHPFDFLQILFAFFLHRKLFSISGRWGKQTYEQLAENLFRNPQLKNWNKNQRI